MPGVFLLWGDTGAYVQICLYVFIACLIELRFLTYPRVFRRWWSWCV